MLGETFWVGPLSQGIPEPDTPEGMSLLLSEPGRASFSQKEPGRGDCPSFVPVGRVPFSAKPGSS